MTKRLCAIGLLALSLTSAASAVEPSYCEARTYCWRLGFWITCAVWGDDHNACTSSVERFTSISCNGFDESGQWQKIQVTCNSSSR